MIKQQDVKDFHIATGSHIEESPKLIHRHILSLRENLIEEETKEVIKALGEHNLANIAKELCDLVYVTLGTAVSLGINLNPIWDAVHKSNMEKAKGPKREDGKILKPEGWKPPNIQSLIEEQIYITDNDINC